MADADAPPSESGANPTTSTPDPNAAKAAAAAKPGAGGYSVAKPAGACAVSGRAIAPGEKFMAGVRESPLGLERVDVALEHWPSYGAKADLLAYWQTVMPKAEEKKKVFVDDEVLCTLFERLSETTEPAKINFRFVLGLILMRKRLVIYDHTRHDPPAEPGGDARDTWVVRMKGREDRLDLVDPKLDEHKIVEVSQQLGQILNEEM